MSKAVTLLGITMLTCIGGCVDSVETGEEIPVSKADEFGMELGSHIDPLPSASESGGFAIPDADGDTARDFDGLRLQIPPGWNEIERTPIQRSVLLAKFGIPAVDPGIEMTISSASGGIDANFDRWAGQFTDSTKDEGSLDAKGTTARMLTLTGDYHPGFGKPDGPGSILLGAAFPAEGRDYYVKLTGPAEKINELKEQFRDMIAGAELR